ncbi:MAG: hemolysin III family protein [Pseudomonadota bacterium]
MTLVCGNTRPDFPAYSDREVVADAIVHAVGVALGLAAGISLIRDAALVHSGTALGATVVYAVGLVAMLVASALYNLTHPSCFKLQLRRFDHSAIFLKIAGTYTPVALVMIGGSHGWELLVAVWVLAFAGVAAKLWLPMRWEAASLGLYVALGWSVLLCSKSFLAGTPPTTMLWIAAGGLTYTIGVVFHVWRSLPYQNAIWHAFVLAGSGFIFMALRGVLV